MKRHEALIPLTHDHHHALAQARRMSVVVGTGDAGARLAQAEEFLDFYSRETIHHFREEEELVFALWTQHVHTVAEPLRELLAEHVKIHALVRALRDEVNKGDVGSQVLSELGKSLQDHIRKEEDVIFPLIEREVPDEILRSIQLAPRDRGTKTVD